VTSQCLFHYEKLEVLQEYCEIIKTMYFRQAIAAITFFQDFTSTVNVSGGYRLKPAVLPVLGS